MALKGSAFIAMWHDIAEEGEADYHLWHTREHMLERLSIPGFLRGRRGVNWALQRQRYLTVYEGADLEALRSPAYLERLNNPSAWSQRMMPHFRNFFRVACETLFSDGAGVGGAIATFRADFGPGLDEAGLLQVAPSLAASLWKHDCVCAVHAAVARPEFSDAPTTETKIRVAMREQGFQVLVLVEAVGLSELAGALDQLAREISDIGLTAVRAEAYDMAFLLGRDGGS